VATLKSEENDAAARIPTKKTRERGVYNEGGKERDGDDGGRDTQVRGKERYGGQRMDRTEY